MDAVEFLKEYKRMCEQNKECEDCPLYNENTCGCKVDFDFIDSQESVVHIVEQWAKEHLVKTRQSEFLKMFPEAEIGDDGYPSVAPCQLYSRLCEDKGVCDKCRREFWLKEIE